MCSKSNSKTEQELCNTHEETAPESVLSSLLALNAWLLAFENRPERADQRGSEN